MGKKKKMAPIRQKQLRIQPAIRKAFEDLLEDIKQGGSRCKHGELAEAAILLLLVAPAKARRAALGVRATFAEAPKEALGLIVQAFTDLETDPGAPGMTAVLHTAIDKGTAQLERQARRAGKGRKARGSGG